MNLFRSISPKLTTDSHCSPKFGPFKLPKLRLSLGKCPTPILNAKVLSGVREFSPISIESITYHIGNESHSYFSFSLF